MLNRFSVLKIFPIILSTIAIGPVNAETIDDPDAFIDANLQHILQHEVGHALIDLLKLPVLAQEEDAADLYATMDVLENFDDATAKSILTYAVIANLAFAEQVGDPDVADYYDEHDLDVQRAYRIVCLGFGTDEDAFDSLADRFKMPEDRRDGCIDDAYRSWESWDKVLSPHRRDSDDAVQPSKITIQYQEDDAFSDVRTYFMEISLLEDTARYLHQNFKLPPLHLKAEQCGEANAFFDPEAQSVTMCYELYDLLLEIAE